MSDSDCCGKPAEAAGACCPACGVRGAAVSMATVEALRTGSGPLRDSGWRACGTGPCPVVWYDGEGASFGPGDCRVRVHAKETQADRPACYCFGFTVQEVSARAAARPVSAEVRDRCRRGEDRCETSNPHGRCCLGDLRKLEKAATSSGEGSTPTASPQRDSSPE